jgi:uncharacterized protein (TIGR02117 family)
MPCQMPPHVVTRRVLLRACPAAGMWQALAGCSPRTLPAYQDAPSEGVRIYLIASGWHTEITLPTHAIFGPLRALTSDFPGSQYLAFGWGERNYYMARAPTFSDAMRALLPGPAVLLVTPLHRPPRDATPGMQVFEVGLTTSGLERLSSYLWSTFEMSGDGTPRRLAAGPGPGSAFYAATGTYSATYTCNTWTADGLRAGGIPVTVAGVVLASHVTDQLRSLSGRAARTAGQQPSD